LLGLAWRSKSQSAVSFAAGASAGGEGQGTERSAKSQGDLGVSSSGLSFSSLLRKRSLHWVNRLLHRDSQAQVGSWCCAFRVLAPLSSETCRQPWWTCSIGGPAAAPTPHNAACPALPQEEEQPQEEGPLWFTSLEEFKPLQYAFHSGRYVLVYFACCKRTGEHFVLKRFDKGGWRGGPPRSQLHSAGSAGDLASSWLSCS
jgi:hypothetical protein